MSYEARALTLIDLLCVIAIIAIFATLYFSIFPRVFQKVKNLEKGPKALEKGMKADDAVRFSAALPICSSVSIRG
jgi:Tfp pilus assembly protein PilE